MGDVIRRKTADEIATKRAGGDATKKLQEALLDALAAATTWEEFQAAVKQSKWYKATDQGKVK